MKLVTSCSCGTALTEKDFVSSPGKAERFGLPSGTLGNTQAAFIKVRCSACGLKYIAEVKPGKHGGTIAIGRIFDCIELSKPVETKAPEPVKPVEPTFNKTDAIKARLAKAAAEVKDGYIDIPEDPEA